MVIIDAEKAVFAQKKADLTRLQANLAASVFDLDNARLEVVISEARIAVAISNHEEDILSYKQALARLQAVKNGFPIAIVNSLTAQASYTPGHSAAEDEAALALAKHRADNMIEIEAEKTALAQL